MSGGGPFNCPRVRSSYVGVHPQGALPPRAWPGAPTSRLPPATGLRARPPPPRARSSAGSRHHRYPLPPSGSRRLNHSEPPCHREPLPSTFPPPPRTLPRPPPGACPRCRHHEPAHSLHEPALHRERPPPRASLRPPQATTSGGAYTRRLPLRGAGSPRAPTLGATPSRSGSEPSTGAATSCRTPRAYLGLDVTRGLDVNQDLGWGWGLGSGEAASAGLVPGTRGAASLSRRRPLVARKGWTRARSRGGCRRPGLAPRIRSWDRSCWARCRQAWVRGSERASGACVRKGAWSQDLGTHPRREWGEGPRRLRLEQVRGEGKGCGHLRKGGGR
jgi:hypothetical protein